MCDLNKNVFEFLEQQYLNLVRKLLLNLNKHVYFKAMKDGKTIYHITIIKFDNGNLSPEEWNNVFNNR